MLTTCDYSLEMDKDRWAWMVLSNTFSLGCRIFPERHLSLQEVPSWQPRSVWMSQLSSLGQVCTAVSRAALRQEQTVRLCCFLSACWTSSCIRLESLPASSRPFCWECQGHRHPESGTAGGQGSTTNPGILGAPRPAKPSKLLLPLAGGCFFWPHPPGTVTFKQVGEGKGKRGFLSRQPLWRFLTSAQFHTV